MEGSFFFIGKSIFSRAGTVWVTESRKSRDLEDGARVAALQASGLGLGFGVDAFTGVRAQDVLGFGVRGFGALQL